MKTTTKKVGDGGARRAPPEPGAPIRDGSGDWSAGLRHDGQAALVGSIVAAIPHLDELVADIAALRLGPAARTVLAALDGDDTARLALLRSLPGIDDALSAAIEDYAAARRLCRSYARGLWYTHRSARTYLAAPDAEGAAFRVAREVKRADLENAVQLVDRLAVTLAALRDAPVAHAPRDRPTASKPRTAAQGPKAQGPKPVRAAAPRGKAAGPPGTPAEPQPPESPRPKRP
ncbi:MAG: hypothetical protein J0H08_09380, partial [Rhizobiales bacterium]|nr:hypothetical protein [Hyphomicrobiales bacterium]